MRTIYQVELEFGDIPPETLLAEVMEEAAADEDEQGTGEADDE